MLSAEKMNKIVEAIERAINISFSGAVGDIDSPAGRVVVFPNQTAPQFLVADFPQLSATVVGAISGAAGSGSIEVFGNVASTFPAGLPFRLLGSKANDGYYRVAAAGSSSTMEASGYITTIPVNEAVADDSASGNVYWELTPQAVTASSAGSGGTGTFGVAGDFGGMFAQDFKIGVGRCANAGAYTLAIDPEYDSGTNTTTFTVNEPVPASGAGGYLWPHYPSPEDTPVLFPACTPANLTFDSPVGSETAQFGKTGPLYTITPTDEYIPRGSLVLATQSKGTWVPLGVMSREGFLFVGGGSPTAAPRLHGRLDPETGADLWTVDRGASLLAMDSDSNGCLYTGGSGTSTSTQTASILYTAPGSGGSAYFVLSGNYSSTFTAGFIFTVSVSSGNNGSYTVVESQSYGFQTYIYVEETVADSGGGTISWTITGSGNTHEKWSSSGAPIWRAAAGYPVTAIVVSDNDGTVLTGTVEGSSSYVRKWSAIGTQIETGGFPISLPSPFGGAPINAIDIDAIDGRIAVGVGTLQTSFGVTYQNKYDLLLFTSAGVEITAPTWVASGNLFTGPQASCKFDVDGTLYTVGVCSSSEGKYTVGFILDYNSNFVNWINWMQPGNAYNFGYAAVADGLGRALIGANAMLTPSPNGAGQNDLSAPYTIGVFLKTPDPQGQVEYLWNLAVEQYCFGLAVDRAGQIYAACCSPSPDGNTLAQVYAFDPLGNSRWKSNFWPSGFATSAFAASLGGFPLPLLVSAK
jgi:hypothetical protein